MLSLLIALAAATFTPKQGEPTDAWVDVVRGDSDIIKIPRVREVLGIDEDKFKKFVEEQRQIVTRTMNEVDAIKTDDTDPRPQRERFKDVSLKYEARDIQCDQLISAMLDRAKFKRYKQLSIQRMRAYAFTRPEIIAYLELNDPQREKITGIIDESLIQSRIIEGNIRSKNPREISASKVVRELDSVKKKAVPKCLPLLTKEQLSTWEKMTGPPFEFFPELPQN